MTYLLGGCLAIGVFFIIGRQSAYKALLAFLVCYILFNWMATDQIGSKTVLVGESTVQDGTILALISDVFQKAALLGCLFLVALQMYSGTRQTLATWGVRVILFYFVCCSLLALVSVTPGFLWSEAWALAFLMAFASSQEPAPNKLATVTWYFAAIAFASLIAILIAPFKAMDPYSGYLPFRLRGVLDNANSLGMCTGAGLILALYLKEFRNLHRVGLTILFLFILIPTQSKTIIIFILALLIIKFVSFFLEKFLPRVSPLSPARVAWIMAGIGIVALPFLDFDNLLSSATSMFGITNDAALTLTGRQAIWDITLQTWAEHPLVGYGPGLWGIEFREKLGMPFAGQAHNQYLQTLGEFGLLGALVLGVYLILIARRAWRLRATLPVGLPLLGLLLTVGMVEAPLRDPSYRMGFLVHIALLTGLSIKPQYKNRVPMEHPS